MKKRIKEKSKLKKKIYIISSIILLLIFLLGSFFLYKNMTLKDIKKHYNKYIVTSKKTYLYNKKKKKIGTISKNFYLELDKKEENNKYFKIKENPYYIYYKDTAYTKKKEEKPINKDIVPFDKNIKTNKEIELKENDKNVISIKTNLSIPIEYQDKDKYYVYFLDKLLSVNKSQKIKEVDNKNTEEKTSSYISVLYYENIDENCSGYECTTYNSLKDQLNKLKENGYYTISTEEYKSFLSGYVRLKEKAILLLTPVDNDNINQIEKELDLKIEKYENNDNFKLNLTNKKSTINSKMDAVETYNIKSYTTVDNILKMANGEEVIENAPVITNSSAQQKIAVLNYHFFYDPAAGENCNEIICLDVAKFREHLEYLKNNNYKTLTMNEFMRWMYGEIELPEKSVLITVDDGAWGTGKHNGNKLIPLLEEYKMHATLFLIAGWWDIENYRSPYLDIQSHSFDMHQYGDCGRGQLNCATYDKAKEDLKKSLDIIGNNDSFCFPFYMYSPTSLQAVKDSGFKIAFVGGNIKAKRTDNKFLIPRYPILDSITLQEFINIIS